MEHPLTGSSPPSSRPRDPYLDNARAILITLVVVGHSLESVTSYLGGAVATWIYAFHMPAFVAICGYLSRSFTFKPHQIRNLLTTLLIPYAAFQVIQAAIRTLALGRDFSVHLWFPSWTLWFLLALFFWRLLTPLLRVIRNGILFGVTVSVLAPMTSSLDQTLTWGRVLSFLPFFILGLKVTPEHLAKLQAFRFRSVGWLILGGGLIMALATHEMFRISIFHMSTSYEIHGVGNFRGAMIRLMVLIVGTAAVFAFMLIVPRQHYWWTNVGRNSLTVYLLHAALFLPLRNSDFMANIDSSVGTLIIIGIAIGATLILSRNVVAQGVRWLTNPPIGNWLVPTDGDRPRSSATS